MLACVGALAGARPAGAARRAEEPPEAPRAVFARLAAPRIVTISWVEQKRGGKIDGYEVVRDGRVIASVSEVTAVTEGGLAAGIQYCWSVRAFGGGGRSAPVTACARTPSPRELYADEAGAPALVAPTVTGSQSARDEIRLSWNATRSAAGAVRYEVVRDGSVRTKTTETQAVAKQLATATRYCFTVTARDAAGNASAPSEPACIATADVTAPSVPRDLAASAFSSSQVALSWSESTDDLGVVRYEIFRDGVPLAEAVRPGATDSGLASGATSCYAVRALDAAGNASAATTPVCATTPAGVPAAPLEVKAEATGETAVRVAWAKPREDVAVAEYEIVHEGTVRARASTSTAEVTGLPPGAESCLSVRARTAAGVASAEGGPACARTPDLTPPQPPSGLVAQAAGDREVRLRWGASPDNVRTVRYHVEREGEEVASVETTEASEADLRPGRSYCYDVVAEDAAGNRSRAARACSTTPDLTAPSSPAEVLASAPLPGTVEVGWEPAEDDVGVVAYEVLRGGAVVANVKAPPAQEGKLRPKTSYCYTVRAVDAAGNRSKQGEPVCATTPDDRAVPGPRQLRALARSPSSIELTWDGPRRGRVAYLVTLDGEDEIGATLSTRYLVKGIGASERHCYRVVAVDDRGRRSVASLPACVALRETETGERSADTAAR